MEHFTALTRFSLSEAALYVCLTALVFLAARQFRQWYRLRHIPGPTSAGWSKWWQLRSAMGGAYHERLKDAAEKYGTLHLCLQLDRHL